MHLTEKMLEYYEEGITEFKVAHLLHGIISQFKRQWPQRNSQEKKHLWGSPEGSLGLDTMGIHIPELPTVTTSSRTLCLFWSLSASTMML